MNTSRLVYRSRQFWQAISTGSSHEDTELAATILTPPQLELFQQMHRSEQAHSLRVLKELRRQGEDNSDLEIAALLHDVGKIRTPLRLWERVLVVLVRKICPNCVKKWGAASENEPGWRRAFVVAEKHPAWGADLVSQSGGSALAAALVARHQEQLPPNNEKKDSNEDRLLYKLQVVDNQS
jgi:predicted hydrolase (HD superfamily)